MVARTLKRILYTLLALAGVGLALAALFLLSQTAQNSDQFNRLHNSLLVINIHGVNFSLGMQELRRQMAAAGSIIAAHQGPVLFSGDFNTWRGGRLRLVNDTLGNLGLEALEYDADHRKRFLGWPLDHIYVRGLDAVTATTYDVDSSDHRPMRVELRLVPDTRVGLADE